VTKLVQKTATIKSRQARELTNEQLYRLWKCAIKDDDRLVDALIQKFYDTMIAFDPKRAEIVIRLTVNRHEAAEATFHRLLRDITMRNSSSCQVNGLILKYSGPPRKKS
jgi:hypothetical protein